MYVLYVCNYFEQAADAFKRLVLSASSDWTTSAYDGIQKLQNNIYSEKWK